MTNGIDRKNIPAFVGQRVQLRETHVTTGYRYRTDTISTPAGSTATIVRVHPDSSDHRNDVIDIEWDEPEKAGEDGDLWSFGWFDVIDAGEQPADVESIPTPAIVEAPARPLVHFDDEKAGRDRSKARAYARRAMSKVLSEDDNEILAAAANGESVDAYYLNRAILAAMRSSATRLGQSMARRQMATEFAHLGHIVQATLENHADNLPAYEAGERSRALQHAGDRDADQRNQIEALTHRLAASEEKLGAYIQRVTSAQDSADEAWAEVARLQRILDYTRTECVADEQARQRSFGFEDGLRAER